MSSPGQFGTDDDGIRKVAADVDLCGRELRTVRTTLAGLGQPTTAVYGGFGVTEAMAALLAAWDDETTVIADAIAEFGDAIRRAADHYREADQRAAGRIDGMWGH
jgi:uncharacterized protein YukE